MVCSHCGVVGHNYVKCPQLTQEQIKGIKEEKKKKKEEVAARRRQREERARVVAEQKAEKEKNKLREYSIFNNNDYEIVLYWGHSNCETGNLKRFLYVPPHSNSPFTASRFHRIVAFPLLEVIGEDNFTAKKEVILKQGDTEDDTVRVLDVNLKDYPELVFQVQVKYEKKKTEVEQWKEFGLKSHFLLKQIENLSSSGKKDEEGYTVFHEKYENIIPFLEMIEGIKVPTTCSDVDKERAGIPSKLTNVT